MARLVQAAVVLVGVLLVSGCGEAPKKESGPSVEEMKKRMQESSKAQMEQMKEKMKAEKPKEEGEKADKKDK